MEIKRYSVFLESDRFKGGFEFQTEHDINTKEFWDELKHDSFFIIGEGIYKPLSDYKITSIIKI